MREEFLARLILAVFLRDHPRACGKNGSTMNKDTRGLGSPPRMREEYNPSGESLLTPGITPAHAGRMLGLRRILGVTEDHPRACGKNYTCFTTITLTQGSPPRMREELNKGNTTSSLERITPAHAGRISAGAFPSAIYRDHPRACGKNFPYISYRHAHHGITPAHAGRISCFGSTLPAT